MSLKHTVPEEPRAPSLVPPAVAALLSLLLPGLGQALARSLRRGLLLLFSFATLGGLLAWRIRLAAPRDEGAVAIARKAFHLQPFLLFNALLLLLLYLWIAWDAWQTARRTEGAPVGIFALVLVAFFAVGWQVGGIDPVRFVTQLDEAGPPLMRVLWPWERAIEYPQEVQIVKAPILSPCTGEPFAGGQPKEGEPYLLTDPTCGNPSEQDGTPGTTFTLRGFGLEPNSEAEIWWEDPIGNEFRQRQEGEYVTVQTDAQGNFEVQIVMPYRLLPPSAGEGPKIWTVEARQVVSVGKPQASKELKLAIEKIIETIFIGMMATFFGILLALPVSFFAARNLMSASPFTLVIYYLTRAVLNVIRSIEPLIWAIIFVIVVGLGPFAGILALTVHSIAALGKLYSESIESIDPGPIEAIQATGANWIQTVRYAVVPQIIPPFVSFTIYRWDINIRMSTIIGFVGGGGIGFLLAQWIRLLDYRAAGIAVWFIAITVAILDYVSAEIRARFV
ncbi:MAG TPA: phosphonate ABC transporter, permease protein PhnE [Chloroflexi bacterium]|nr:phosphonate ABC transporter, permease protein PhnE [Chloroflexota bacterium]